MKEGRTTLSAKDMKVKKEFRKAFAIKEEMRKKLDKHSTQSKLQEEIELLNIKVEYVGKLMRVGEAEVADDKVQILELQRKLRNHEQNLQELKLRAEQLEGKRQEMEGRLNNLQKLEKEFGRTILLHNSATTKQIVCNINGKIVTTKRDAGILEEKGVSIDEIFRPRTENLLDIPKDIAEKYTPFTWNRIIDFCEMVANYKLDTKPGEEENIILLYSNLDIAEILKANGLEVH